MSVVDLLTFALTAALLGAIAGYVVGVRDSNAGELKQLLREGLEWSDPMPAAAHELDSLARWQERTRDALAAT